MKILYLVSEPSFRIDAATGYGAHIRGIVNSFKNHGHEVVTAVGKESNQSDGPAVSAKETAGLKRLLKRLLPSFLLKNLRQLYLMAYDRKLNKHLQKLVDDSKPDAIYERAAYLSRAGSLIGKRNNIPVFIESNGTTDLEGRSFFGRSPLFHIAKRYEKLVYNDCTHIFAISKPVKQSIISSYDINPDKITVVSNGVDPEKLKPGRNIKELRKEIGLPENSLTVGFVGSLLPWHGADKLLESAAECLERMPNLCFLIVGGENTRTGIRIRQVLNDRALSLGIEERVFFTGPVLNDQIPDFIDSMDICVYPGSSEHPNPYGSPIKLFEYGMLGKPVITFRSEVTAEIIKDGESGILITPGSITELTKAILRLVSEPDLGKMFGNRLREKVSSNYTWENIGGRVLDVMSKYI